MEGDGSVPREGSSLVPGAAGGAGVHSCRCNLHVLRASSAVTKDEFLAYGEKGGGWVVRSDKFSVKCFQCVTVGNCTKASVHWKNFNSLTSFFLSFST